MSGDADFGAGHSGDISGSGGAGGAGGPESSPNISLGAQVRGYLIGLALSAALTVAAFWAVGTHLIYGPGIMMAIVALAVAQMGIHLVFFLHLTTDPDNTNTVLVLAFGVLIVGLVVFGSVWVMYHLNQHMVPMEELLRMQR
ncbi:MAG: cytochrome o ubiquinol oxidase subunit IV [Pseudomonadota bacterium]|nr:cytochrome o ubiquinol oxidase subunit IV [Pseudomonadota bacterium]